MENKIRVLLENADKKLKTNDIKGAIGDYEQVVAIEPDNEKVFFEMGRLFFQLGEFPPALNAFNRVLDINPSHKEARVNVEMINSILNFYDKNRYNP